MTTEERNQWIYAGVASVQGDPALVGYLVDHGANPCAPLSDELADLFGVTSLVELARAEGSDGMADAFEVVTADCK